MAVHCTVYSVPTVYLARAQSLCGRVVTVGGTTTTATATATPTPSGPSPYPAPQVRAAWLLTALG